MKFLVNLDLKKLDELILKDLSTEMIEHIKMNPAFLTICDSLRERIMIDTFTNSKHINIVLMQYCMDLLDKEEEEKKQKLEEIERKKMEPSRNSEVMKWFEAGGIFFNVLFVGILIAIWIFTRDS